MPTYATAETVTRDVPGLVIDDAAAFNALIERAERDVDRLLGPRVVIAATGRKLDPSLLAAWERAALERTVAAQVEHLLEVAAEQAAGPAVKREQGPDFTVDYAVAVAAPRSIGQRTADELAAINHLRVLAAFAP